MSNYEVELYKIIGSMLRDARLKCGFTLEHAGEKAGVTAKTIQRYEMGQRKISIEKLMELTSLFGVDYTSFIASAKKCLAGHDNYSDAAESSHQAEEGYYLDEEVVQIAQQVYERPELRMLFSASKNVSPEDIKAVIAIVDRMKKEDD